MPLPSSPCRAVLSPARLSLPHLGRPAVDTLAAAADLEIIDAHAFHAGGVVEPEVAGHAAGVGALLGDQLEHGRQEVGDALVLVVLEVVLFPQHVGERPMPQPMDVAQLAFPVEDFLRPLARQAQRLGERAQQLDDLRDVIVVFAVLGARLRIEQIVACNELKNLGVSALSGEFPGGTYHGSHAPYVGAGAPFRAEDDLGRPILPSLDVVGEVVVDPARVAEIGNLDTDDI